MKLDLRDVRFEAFSSSGPGGQYRNRHANCVRAIHEPTGVIARATKERSLTQNKNAAIKALAEKLVTLKEDAIAMAKRERRANQPDAAFGGAQIRTYRFIGPPGVIDHRSGGRFGLDVLDGKLDQVIEAGMTAQLAICEAN
jgi:protein subunit release factor A